MLDSSKKLPIMIMCHGRPTLKVAEKFGWLPGARYTNLRDIRGFSYIGLIDIDWRKYDFQRHLEAVKICRPHLTIAQDVVNASNLKKIIDQAKILNKWSEKVVIAPKDLKLGQEFTKLIPQEFILGYSVPTKYGSTSIPLEWFRRRHVHLLGGRPDVQFQLAKRLNVYSLDGNRITLDARFGDYFDGTTFRPHPVGGYYKCIQDSLKNINKMWETIPNPNDINVIIANSRHLSEIKMIADKHKKELGFVLRPAIKQSIKTKCVLIAIVNSVLVGFVRFHHRKDSVTKIYEICVDSNHRLRKIGKTMIEVLKSFAIDHKQVEIALKCPTDLLANKFYKRIGFMHYGYEQGKKRQLTLWKYKM